jgi:uncharacterized RDD family membrane protein YckC
MLDTIAAVTTPEGVLIQLQVAGPPVRMLAWAFDVVVRSFAYVLAAIGVGVLGEVGAGLWFLILFCGEWGYPVLFEVWGRGATPGKRLFGLRVLHDDATPVRLSASLLRNLLRFVDFLPAAFGFGLVAMAAHPRFQRLGDLAAGTLVVYHHGDHQAGRIAESAPQRPAIPLSLEEGRAVVDFASRLGQWTDERAIELSNQLQPLTGESGPAGRDRLLAIANWLVGRR